MSRCVGGDVWCVPFAGFRLRGAGVGALGNADIADSVFADNWAQNAAGLGLSCIFVFLHFFAHLCYPRLPSVFNEYVRMRGRGRVVCALLRVFASVWPSRGLGECWHRRLGVFRQLGSEWGRSWSLFSCFFFLFFPLSYCYLIPFAPSLRFQCVCAGVGGDVWCLRFAGFRPVGPGSGFGERGYHRLGVCRQLGSERGRSWSLFSCFFFLSSLLLLTDSPLTLLFVFNEYARMCGRG